MPSYIPILEITDGTQQNTFNLLGRGNGFLLDNWQQATPLSEYSYAYNQKTGARYPTSMQTSPPVETFTGHIRDTSPGSSIAHSRKLYNVLMNAVGYWLGDKSVQNPYYIKFRPKGVAQVQYATILSVTFPTQWNPFSQPFATNAKNKTIQDVTFSIERDMYSPNPPFTVGAAGIVSTMDNPYDSVDGLGMSPDNMYMPSEGEYGAPDYSFAAAANHCATVSLTHVWSAANWNNLLTHSGSVPQLFPNTTNYTYFGVECADFTEQHGFTNIVIVPSKTATKQNNTYDWEYYSGYYGGWTTLDVFDTSDSMQKPGVVHWHYPYFWTRTDVNGVTGLWVRARRMTGSASSTLINVKPYTASWNHIEVPASAKGSSGTRLDIRFTQSGWSEPSSGAPSFEKGVAPNRVAIGGSGKKIYSAISPAYYSEPLKIGATWNLPKIRLGVDSNYATSYWTPYISTQYTHATANSGLQFVRGFQPVTRGRAAELNSDKWVNFGEVTFTNDGSNMYSGNFRAFVRFYMSAWSTFGSAWTPENAPSMRLYATVGNRKGTASTNGVPQRGDEIQITQKTPTRVFNNMEEKVYVLDLGVITLGNPDFRGYGINKLYQSITIVGSYDNVPAVNNRLHFVDITLIPTDEFYLELSIPPSQTSNSSSALKMQDIIINTASSLGEIEGWVAEHDGSEFTDRSQFKYSGIDFPVGSPLYIPGNNTTYLYFFSYHDDGLGKLYSSTGDVFAIDAASSRQYATIIGDEF